MTFPYYHELKFSQKYPRFNKVAWKFQLPLLLRGKVFAKIWPFCWYDLKIRPAPIITSWNFLKNKTVLMVSLEKLNLPYYKEVKFLQKYRRFNEITWKFELPLVTALSIAKSKAVCWCDLKIWPAPIIIDWNFLKNKAFFDDIMWNFEPALLSRSEFFAKVSQI